MMLRGALALLCFVYLNLAQNQDDIQLFRGSDSSGIVQVYDTGTWKTLCGTNFGKTEAAVVCRSLNYTDGTALPYTAFGQATTGLVYPDVLTEQGCETGTEPDIYSCQLDEGATCTEQDWRRGYASVNCFDTVENIIDYSVKLDDEGTAYSGYFSTVLVYKNHTWGHICGQFWDDDDAQVVCRQLGYQGGVASYSKTDWSIPTLLMETGCNGTEDRLSDCTNIDVECLTDKVADVVCYNSQSPQLELVGGKTHYGYVTMNIDGRQGYICGAEPAWGYEETYAVCKTLGYTSGFPVTGLEKANLTLPSSSEVFIERLTCSFDDDTIYTCDNSGWRVLSGECDDLKNVAAVYCYTSVRLVSSPRVFEQEDVHMGRVEILANGRWRAVCADAFSQTDADIVCRELGFSKAEVSLPGNFGNGYYLTYPIERLDCDGSEPSLINCSYTVGYCNTNREHSALICTQDNVTRGSRITFSLADGYHGDIIAERYGVKGRVCPDDWDDSHADVFCRSLGYVTGFALGSLDYTYRTSPVWATGFVCRGGEDSLEGCGYLSDLMEDWSCADDYTVAGVLCYSGKPPNPIVRGQGSLIANNFLTEIYHDVTGWGTICNDGTWSNANARVYCREVGYPYGRATSTGYNKGQANQPIVLSGVDCKGTETSILQCTNNGWLSNISVCQDHRRDAGVYCYSWVKVEPAVSHGVVLYHDMEDYGLVCADGFDDNSATVVCRNQELIQFPYGISLCCSALGPRTESFTLSNVSCTGSESSLRDCSYIDENPTCSSGLYAAVACGTVQIGYTNLVANPVVQVTYFSQTGFVCSEGFTDKDAAVVCKQLGYSHSAKFKASAQDYTYNIRWLRGFGCDGNESSILGCRDLDWGNIGLCSWDSVAAVRCTNNPDDLQFDIRIVDGTDISGRVEIKIDNQWGTLCGNDLTKNEATVICRQLGYHDGVAMAPGHYGAGQGPVHLSGVSCEGTEASLTDCIWSGYRAVTSLCTHSLDAAVTCLDNIRLSGSTTVNYGRLEVYNFEENDWVAVCENSLFRNEAQLICGQLGYSDGLVQFGSPLGPTNVKILVTGVNCATITKCTFTTGECSTNRYAALYCSASTISTENAMIRLPLDSFYGPVSIQRYRLWGHICSVEFDDVDAAVACRDLGYRYGRAVKTYKTQGFPIIQGNMNCTGLETNLADCDRDPFIYDHGCYSEDTVAGVMCYNTEGDLSLSSTDLDTDTGKMTTIAGLELNSEILRFDYTGFTDVDAAIYCETLNYAGGEVYRSTQGGYGVTKIGCEGTEGSILDCPGIWDPTSTQNKQGDLAGVICYTAVRLVGGDPSFYGIVYTSKGVNTGPVCSAGFDQTDADVACKSLNYNAGLVLCCASFGDIEDTAILTNVGCVGTEKQFTDCPHDDVSATSAAVCQRNYGAVVCYNTPKPIDYTLSLSGSTDYTGHVIVSHLGVYGSICNDGWNDNSASVACNELGYSRGVAYTAARSNTSPGPFWMSNVQCTGNEARLSDCQLTDLGMVDQCSNFNTQAGVICFDNEGIFYRLGGTDELRYGRVEISIHGEWRSVCNLFWENEDSHVLCKMLGFSTGEVYNGAINGSLSGPVWEVNYQCDGTESNLNLCVSTGWRVSTLSTCTQHQHDAAAFCYKSVKLSTGVGRETDQGAVLLYKDDQWYRVCCDGFNDTSAQVVCKELGFRDGQALGCSSYGDLGEFPLLRSHKIGCDGDETDVQDCLIPERCNGNEYAGVVCYAFLQATEPTTTEEKKFDALPIIIAVVLFVVLIVIAIIVAVCVVKYRRRQKIEKSKQIFDRTIISEHVDGSIIAENRLSGLVGTPQVPRVQYNRNTEDVNSEAEIVYDNGLYSGLKTSRGEDNHGYSNLHDNTNTGVRRTTNSSKDYLVPVYTHKGNDNSVSVNREHSESQDAHDKVREPESTNSSVPGGNKTVITITGGPQITGREGPAGAGQGYDNMVCNREGIKSNNTDDAMIQGYNNTTLRLSQQDELQLKKDSVQDSDLQVSGKRTH